MFLEYRRSGSRYVFALAYGKLTAICTRMFFLCAHARRAGHRGERERRPICYLKLDSFSSKRSGTSVPKVPSFAQA
jgi:hypothetical protein